MVKGLPIGNLTSQFLANLYLNELDYFVKFQLRVRHYIRYMDDFLIFGNDKKALIEVKGKIRDFLKERLALQMHEGKSQIYNTEKGIKFLGFRIYKDYRRLTSDNVRRFRKRLGKFTHLFENGEMNEKEIRDSVRCWVAHSKHASTGGLRHRLFKDLVHKKLESSLKDILLDTMIVADV
ncbi:MAG: RNA-directed DNA polymerase [Candidatus Omnitrophica bacterium]|nr:RNA-directed DNA polymerase [Candidatus Omnitrophota bacterium]